MDQKAFESDLLRQPSNICEPDSRTHLFVRVDRKNGQSRELEIQDKYDFVASFQLKESVPKNVFIHFETAKNLYLYSWFVYRFYSVAEQQALASLEFALRERFPGYFKQNPRAGLGKLLKYAIKNGYLKNELFTRREHWAWQRAKQRLSFEMLDRMRGEDLTEIRWSEADVVVTDEDLNYNWLEDFMEIMPDIRNNHAHGSANLYPASVGRTFEIVSELINQLFSGAAGQ